MTTMRIAVAVAIAAAWASGAAAQDLPRWSLVQACPQGSADRPFCLAFERRAFGQVSGIWPTLPSDIRQACLQAVQSFGQESYRLLEDCIEEKLTEMRVTYVREASRSDIPDPPPAAEPAAEPAPEMVEPASEPAPAAVDEPKPQ